VVYKVATLNYCHKRYNLFICEVLDIMKHTLAKYHVRLLVAAFATVGLAAAILAPFFIASADTGQPDSVNIHDITVYNSLIETDDFLVIAPYTISYATAPSSSIDKTFLFELLGVDGSSIIGQNLAYSYYNSGYGQGLVSFYFSANVSPAWGLSYNIKVLENPALFTAPTYWTLPIASSSYSAYTSNQTANRALLQNNIVTLAQKLTTAWSISLTEQGGSGIILSSYGEAYFRNAIYGLQNMCPDLFLLQNTNLDYTSRSWDYSFTTLLLNTFSGSPIGDAMTGFAGLWGVPTTTATSFIIFFIAIAFFGLSVWLSGQQGQYVQASFLDAMLVINFGALAGWFSPLINALFSFLFVFVGAWILLLSRA
jgi:hypothetical protein